MSNDWNIFWAVIGIAVLVVIMLLFPLVEIWALNTLFNTGISNWEWNTYFAMIVVDLVIASRTSFSKKS